MKRLLAAASLLIAVTGVLLISEGASATNGILDDFAKAYPATAGTGLANCSTCHTSVPALNPYGSALRAAGFNFGSIEGQDSDGDGFTNLQEIQGLTSPGNASDHPAPTTTSTSTTSSSTTTTTTDRVGGTATSTTTTTVETASPSGATAFDAGPAGTVWLAVQDGQLVVTNVDTTWGYELDDNDAHEIEIEFQSGDVEVEFEAELEHGVIRIELEVENDVDDRDDNDQDHADEDDDDDDRRHRDEDDHDDDDDDVHDDHDD